MTLVDTTRPPSTGGPALAQERRLVTAIPGPRSQELMARKAEAVAAGVGTTIPVSIVAAGGGVLVDADGNSLIDLGSGIAVTGVGNANPRVVEAVTAQLERLHAHVLHRRAVRLLRRRRRESSTSSPPATTSSARPSSTRAPRPSRTR